MTTHIDIPGVGAGPHQLGWWKLVLHTTEGSSLEGAVSAYRANNTWPHRTVCPVTRRVAHHLPYETAARALARPAGSVATNQARAIQVEMVGRAGDTHNWSEEDIAWLSLEVFKPICDDLDIKYVAPTFYGTDCGWTLASEAARQRFSPNAWINFNGICSHQHVPSNHHWDAGKFPIRKAIAYMEDDMFTDEDRRRQNFIYDELTKRLPNRVDGKTEDTLFGAALNADAAAFRSQRNTETLIAKVDALTALLQKVPAATRDAVLEALVNVETYMPNSTPISERITVRDALGRASDAAISRRREENI